MQGSASAGASTLLLTDTRTGLLYRIPVADNRVLVKDLRMIRARQTESPEDEEQEGEPLVLVDPAAEFTAVAETQITYIDSKSCMLAFRGYTLDQLIGKYDYEHVSYLVIFDRHINAEEIGQWRHDIASASNHLSGLVDSAIRSMPASAPHWALIMTGLTASVGTQADTMPCRAGMNMYLGNPRAVDDAVSRVLGTFMRVVAVAHSHMNQRPIADADPTQSYTYNLCRMMGILTDPRTGQPDPQLLSLLERFAVLAVDHGLTASTTTLISAASTLCDPVSAVVCAIASASGILHFGAAEASYHTMCRIGGPENVSAAIEQVKRGKMRLMGVGHRVYKVADPRRKPVKEIIAILEAQGKADQVLPVAREIERQVTSDPWFIEKGLCVNVDLYWPLMFTAFGVPIESAMPTCLAFRMSGYMAHWRALMLSDKTHKIWRGKAIYNGRPIEQSLPTKSRL